VSQVPALWRRAVCQASAAAMAATIRPATRSACHQPSVSYRTRAVSASRPRCRPGAAESAVALQRPAGHPPAESVFGISQRREDNEGDTSRRQGDARCAGLDPLARAEADWTVSATATAARAIATTTVARVSDRLAGPGRRCSSRNRQIRTADPVTSARTSSPTAKTPRLWSMQPRGY
jgi:hypothetical protein